MDVNNFRRLTKRNIFSDSRISDFGNPDGISTKLLTEIRSSGYNINLNMHNGLMVIAYKSSEYTLKDLFCEDIPKGYFGGRGKDVLKKCKYIHYEYIDGTNTYTVDFTRNNCMSSNFEFNYYVTCASDSFYIFTKIMDLTQEWSEDGEYSEWSNVLNELICNIVQNTNIIEMYYDIKEQSYIIYDVEGVVVKEYSFYMAIEHVQGNIYSQVRNTQLTERDIDTLCRKLSSSKLTVITVIWFSGKSIYGLDLSKYEKNYNVRVNLT